MASVEMMRSGERRFLRFECWASLCGWTSTAQERDEAADEAAAHAKECYDSRFDLVEETRQGCRVTNGGG